MSSETVLKVDHVGKRFNIFKTPAQRLFNALSFGLSHVPQPHWALKDVNLTVRRGESVGLLGANGSGKSTLLQMVAGTMTPTVGSIEIGGRVAALLELGTGFHADFTGRENARLSMRLLAPDEKDPDERMRWIEDFAEIGESIDRPVRTYSSGMFVRLAFAAMASVRPDVLIVDEALVVGDAAFQTKCYRFMSSRMENTARLIVSHNLSAIEDICDRVCILSDGKILYDGPTAEGVRLHKERARPRPVAEAA